MYWFMHLPFFVQTLRIELRGWKLNSYELVPNIAAVNFLQILSLLCCFSCCSDPFWVLCTCFVTNIYIHKKFQVRALLTY